MAQPQRGDESSHRGWPPLCLRSPRRRSARIRTAIRKTSRPAGSRRRPLERSDHRRRTHRASRGRLEFTSHERRPEYLATALTRAPVDARALLLPYVDGDETGLVDRQLVAADYRVRSHAIRISDVNLIAVLSPGAGESVSVLGNVRPDCLARRRVLGKSSVGVGDDLIAENLESIQRRRDKGRREWQSLSVHRLQIPCTLSACCRTGGVSTAAAKYRDCRARQQYLSHALHSVKGKGRRRTFPATD